MRGQDRDIRHITIDALVRSLEALATDAAACVSGQPTELQRRALELQILRAKRVAGEARRIFGRNQVPCPGRPFDSAQELEARVGSDGVPPLSVAAGRTPTHRPLDASRGPALTEGAAP
jgi:hypothetical protein